MNTVSLHVLDTAFRELGLGREQTNEVLQVVEVESILSKVFQLAHKNDLGGFNKSLVCLEQVKTLMTVSFYSFPKSYQGGLLREL